MNNPARITALAALALVASCQGPVAADRSAAEPAGTAAQGTVEVGTLNHACRSYALNNQEFPDQLSRLVERDSTGVAYLQEASAPVSDVWGQPYGYELLAGGSKCRISSLGKDGAVGGEGDSKDVKVTLVLPTP